MCLRDVLVLNREHKFTMPHNVRFQFYIAATMSDVSSERLKAQCTLLLNMLMAAV